MQYVGFATSRSGNVYLRKDGSWASPKIIQPGTLALFNNVLDALRAINFANENIPCQRVAEYNPLIFRKE